MKKAVTICILALCLAAGFAVFQTAEAPPASVTTPPGAAGVPVFEPAPPPPVPAAADPAVSQANVRPQTSPIQTPAASLERDMLSKQLDQVFSESGEFSGNVLIARGGEILLNKSYGMADAENGVENTPDTKFLIGSVTKQFTAMAVMQLYEKGLLDIHDSLSVYIPDFSRGSEITLIHLLTQTSGIVDYMNAEPPPLLQIPYEELSAQAIIEAAAEIPLKFDPGTKYSYSNTNYLILGHIVEKITGLSYGDYLARYIFDPLGMRDTGVYDIENPPENMATGYMRPGAPVRYFTPDGGIIADNASFVKGGCGAGGLYSTAGDLYLWDRALSTEKLLPERYIDMMLNPSVPVPGAVIECAYGYGWVIDSDPDVGTIIRHTGILSGFRVYNGLFIDRDAIVIVLGNIKEFSGRSGLLPALKQVLKTA